MWRVRNGSGRVLYGRPPSDIKCQVGMVQAATADTATPGAEGVQGGIPMDGHSHRIPNVGMSRESDNLHQPPVSFRALACVGHNCDPCQGPWTPPPVRSV